MNAVLKLPSSRNKSIDYLANHLTGFYVKANLAFTKLNKLLQDNFRF